MSKGEPASGSLEDILSSIRKSLSDQSTDVLLEAPHAEPLAERATARREGLVGRLANATVGIPEPTPAPEDDLSDVLEEQGDLPKIAAPAMAAATVSAQEEAVLAAQPAASSADPLWFLTRKEPEAARAAAGSTNADAASLTQPEALRAVLPPFFGASAQGPGVDPVSPQPSAAAQPSGAGTQPGARGTIEREFARVLDPAIAREVSLVAAAAETAGRPVTPGAPLARPAAAGGGEVPHALESMVLELLKPMMRQWLDQNMPRLVAAALKDEADRAAAGDASAGKS